MKAILWSFITVMSVQLFYPRGSYKFYLLALVPFIALMFDYNNLELRLRTQYKFQRGHLFGILISLVIFLCFRYVYFWFLGAWSIFYLIKSGTLSQITSRISRIFGTKDGHLIELEEIYSE
jgi:hypothetical protein